MSDINEWKMVHASPACSNDLLNFSETHNQKVSEINFQMEKFVRYRNSHRIPSRPDIYKSSV